MQTERRAELLAEALTAALETRHGQVMVKESISRTHTSAAWPSMTSEIVIDPALVFLLSPVFEPANSEISIS